jgi:citrate synthase
VGSSGPWCSGTPAPAQAALLERALVAAVDHGPRAPSIAAARMAATCGVGLHGAISTGVGLLGDVHGGAGQQCMELLDRIEREARHDPLDQVVARSLAELRAAHRYVPGFGHRFHPRDPRRDPLLRATHEAVRAGTVAGRYLAVAEEMERQLAAGRTRPVPMNIDGATAVIYSELGFAPELGRGLFILSRSVGILAHAWEERSGGRRIKGPIPPPLLPTYVGEPERRLPPRNQSTLE